MKCEKCQDKGFTEEEHGLVIILCDCEAGRRVAEAQGIPWRKDDSNRGAGEDSQNIGSGDTSEPQQPSKPKKKKKARKRAK